MFRLVATVNRIGQRYTECGVQHGVPSAAGSDCSGLPRALQRIFGGFCKQEREVLGSRAGWGRCYNWEGVVGLEGKGVCSAPAEGRLSEMCAAPADPAHVCLVWNR